MFRGVLKEWLSAAKPSSHPALRSNAGNNVTRKNKIRFVAVLLGAGLLATFWLVMGRGGVRVTFAGVSSNDASLVWFTVTNPSRTPLQYFTIMQEHHSNTWIDLELRDVRQRNPQYFSTTLPGHGATNIRCSVTYLKPWRVEVTSGPPRQDSPVFRARTSLAQRASRRNWSRLSRWLRPVTKWDSAYGPEMIANQPVEMAQP